MDKFEIGFTPKAVELFARGLNPSCEIGEEYVLGIHDWFSVWLYVTDLAEDLLSKEETHVGFFPKQLKQEISESAAIEIAKRVLDSIEKGEAKDFGEKIHSPNFSVENLKNFALFAGFSGGFALA
jgi:hypothetical protein